MSRVARDFSTLAGRRPPLSQMTDVLAREAAGYPRPFVVKGRTAWFAYVPHTTYRGNVRYETRGCPTWAEAYAWALGKADRCMVCGTCSHDHGGWTHAFKPGVKVATRDTPDSVTGQYARCTRGCNDHTGHTLGPGCYQHDYPSASRPECGWRLGLCTGCEKCDPDRRGAVQFTDSPESVRCPHCLSPAGMGHEQGCRYEHPRT